MIQHIHFVGIGGIGMSGLARFFVQEGASVTGSDMSDSKLMDALRHEGISVSIGHDAKHLPKQVDFVVYSAAVPLDNPEILAAKSMNIPTLSYFEALGEATKNYFTFCVCGTHGKTTTTALLGLSMIALGLDPMVLVGTKLREFGDKNFRYASSSQNSAFRSQLANFAPEQHLSETPFVFEACEYKRSFLHLHPNVIVLTNLEAEHLDYYRDFDDYVSAFRSFIHLLPKNGVLVYNADDTTAAKLASDALCQTISFGFSDNALYRIHEQSLYGPSEKHPHSSNDTLIAKLQLSIPGVHNMYNAAAALATAHQFCDDISPAISTVCHYSGSWRRFEKKGILNNGVCVYDDYAHHPTEISCTLQAIRQLFPQKRIRVVYQPHQHSRTKKLLSEFCLAFHDADEVIVPNIYAVRDSAFDIHSISASDFTNALSHHHDHIVYSHNFPETLAYLKNTLQDHDVIITMGAGDVWKVADMLLQ